MFGYQAGGGGSGGGLAAGIPVNLLTNGGFELWEGPGSFTNPVSTTNLGNGWILTKAGATPPSVDIALTSVLSERTQGKRGMKIDITAGGVNPGARVALSHARTAIIASVGGGIELLSKDGLTTLRGKIVTLAMDVKTTLPGFDIAIRCFEHSGYTVVASATATHTGGGSWERLRCQVLVPSNTDSIDVYMGINTFGLTGQVYVDSAMLVEGDYDPLPFVAADRSIERLKEMKRYQAGVFESGALGADDGTSYEMHLYVPFVPVMEGFDGASVPTITLAGWVIQEEGAGTNQQASYTKTVTPDGDQGFRVRIYKAAGGQRPNYVYFTWTAEHQ